MTEDADSRPENTPPSHEHATPGHSDRNHSSTGPRPAQGIRLTVTNADGSWAMLEGAIVEPIQNQCALCRRGIGATQ